MRAEAQIQIQAPPERVWGMVSDVTRMGEWSPENQGGEWLDEATGPAVGARFRGRNKQGPMGWSTVCTVTAAEPGREFAFTTFAPYGTTWRYRFEPAAGGTRVTESYELPRNPLGRLLADVTSLIGRRTQMEDGMQQTLERLKTAAEAKAAV